jgi:hypothetical protein
VVGAEPALQIDVVGEERGLPGAREGSHHIWEVRLYLIHLIEYITYIAELGNTPSRRLLLLQQAARPKIRMKLVAKWREGNSTVSFSREATQAHARGLEPFNYKDERIKTCVVIRVV